MNRLVKIVRDREEHMGSHYGSHWVGCEEAHIECLLHMLANEIERLERELSSAQEMPDLAPENRDLKDQIERLRGLVYFYPPSAPYALDGITWKQEAERLQEAGVGYLQQTVDAITAEREELRQEIERLRDALYKIEQATFFSDEANQIARDAIGLEKQFPVGEEEEPR